MGSGRSEPPVNRCYLHIDPSVYSLARLQGGRLSKVMYPIRWTGVPYNRNHRLITFMFHGWLPFLCFVHSTYNSLAWPIHVNMYQFRNLRSTSVN